MTVDEWLRIVLADADRRGLPALKPLLETLAKSTRQLREPDLDDTAAGRPDHAHD
jgi:hypothetical protein